MSCARRYRFCLLAVAVLAVHAAPGAGQTARGPFARIAVLEPRQGFHAEFESGYARHLKWHADAGDAWRWFGWTTWAGDRPRHFIYATFGHAASDFDQAVSPAKDEEDNTLNVMPFATWGQNGLFEFLPALSRGSGEPSPHARLEVISIELRPSDAAGFERDVARQAPELSGELLWFRQIVGGGNNARYVRLRPLPSLASVLSPPPSSVQLPGIASRATRVSVELWTFRPTLSLGVGASR